MSALKKVKQAEKSRNAKNAKDAKDAEKDKKDKKKTESYAEKKHQRNEEEKKVNTLKELFVKEEKRRFDLLAKNPSLLENEDEETAEKSLFVTLAKFLVRHDKLSQYLRSLHIESNVSKKKNLRGILQSELDKEEKKKKNDDPLETYTVTTMLLFIKDHMHLMQDQIVELAEALQFDNFDDFLAQQMEAFEEMRRSFMTESQRAYFNKMIRRYQEDEDADMFEPREYVPVPFKRVKGQYTQKSDGQILYTLPRQQCVEGYKNRPWIPNYVATYFRMDPSSDDFENPELYIDMEGGDPIAIQWQGREYFKASAAFDLLLCTGSNKSQKETMFSVENKGKKYVFEILFLSGDNGDDKTVQDEEIYRIEEAWLHEKNMYLLDLTKKFLTENFEKSADVRQIRETGQQEVLEFFGKEDAYAIEQKIAANSKTIGEYLDRLARILVFVDEKYMKGDAKFFNERLSRQYYNLDTLFDLEFSDIFPEIYQLPSKNEALLEKFETKIKNNINLYVLNKASAISARKYGKRYDIPRRSASFFGASDLPSLTVNDCSNNEDVTNEKSWDIIYFTDSDDNKIYCFKLLDLIEQFSAGNNQNIKTGKEFPADFIKHITAHYQKPAEKVVMNVRADTVETGNNALETGNNDDLLSELEENLSPEDMEEYKKLYKK
jgi:hypothetical protein